MKVESIATPRVPAQIPEELPIIKADEIMSILSLGLRGSMKPDTHTSHAIDTCA